MIAKPSTATLLLWPTLFVACTASTPTQLESGELQTTGAETRQAQDWRSTSQQCPPPLSTKVWPERARGINLGNAKDTDQWLFNQVAPAGCPTTPRTCPDRWHANLVRVFLGLDNPNAAVQPSGGDGDGPDYAPYRAGVMRLLQIARWAEWARVPLVITLANVDGREPESDPLRPDYPLYVRGQPEYDGFLDLWEVIVRETSDNPYVIGYDILNEPDPQAIDAYREDLLPDAIARIRTFDKDAFLIVQPTSSAGVAAFRRFDDDFAPLKATDFPAGDAIGLNQVIYSAHLYSPHRFTHQELPLNQNKPGKGALWQRALEYPSKVVITPAGETCFADEDCCPVRRECPATNPACPENQRVCPAGEQTCHGAACCELAGWSCPCFNHANLRRQLAHLAAYVDHAESESGVRPRMFVGEFSAVRWTEPTVGHENPVDRGGRTWIEQAVLAMEEQGFDWAYHAAGQWNGWDPRYSADPDDNHTWSCDTPRAQQLRAYWQGNFDISQLPAATEATLGCEAVAVQPPERP